MAEVSGVEPVLLLETTAPEPVVPVPLPATTAAPFLIWTTNWSLLLMRLALSALTRFTCGGERVLVKVQTICAPFLRFAGGMVRVLPAREPKLPAPLPEAAPFASTQEADTGAGQPVGGVSVTVTLLAGKLIVLTAPATGGPAVSVGMLSFTVLGELI